jgi:hypothetical protein
MMRGNTYLVGKSHTDALTALQQKNAFKPKILKVLAEVSVTNEKG